MAANGTQSTGVAAFIAASQSRSRPGISAAAACGRCTMMQCSGLLAAIWIASSSSGLYGMTRFPSTPHDADTMSFGLASLIRVASSFGANPPNTTLWIAPIRAHASIAMSASGTIGM